MACVLDIQNEIQSVCQWTEPENKVSEGLYFSTSIKEFNPSQKIMQGFKTSNFLGIA